MPSTFTQQQKLWTPSSAELSLYLSKAISRFIVIINCFVTQARSGCPGSRNRGFRKHLKHHHLSPQEFRTTVRAYANTAPCKPHVPEVPPKIPSSSCSWHITQFQSWKQGPRLWACWEQSHANIVVLLLKIADFNSASAQCCNCTVRCKTTNNRRRKSLSNLADKFPEWQSCSYSTPVKSKHCWTLLMQQEPKHVFDSGTWIRPVPCFWNQKQHIHTSMVPKQWLLFTEDYSWPIEYSRHMVLGTVAVAYNAVPGPCTSVGGC